MGAAMLTEPSLTVGLLHRTATAPDRYCTGRYCTGRYFGNNPALVGGLAGAYLTNKRWASNKATMNANVNGKRASDFTSIQKCRTPAATAT